MMYSVDRQWGFREVYNMAIRVVEFSNGVYKIRKIFASKETIEFWELD